MELKQGLKNTVCLLQFSGIRLFLEGYISHLGFAPNQSKFQNYLAQTVSVRVKNGFCVF